MDSASAGDKNLEENAAASSLDIWKNRIIIPTLVAGFNSVFCIFRELISILMMFSEYYSDPCSCYYWWWLIRNRGWRSWFSIQVSENSWPPENFCFLCY